MTELHILRGLPASGKTTFARAWVAADREHRARVNRDDLRVMVDEGKYVKGVTEGRILAARDAMITALLKRGISVISDDTNLPSRTARDLMKLAQHAGAEWTLTDMTDIQVGTCIQRNSLREDKTPVPADWIMDQYNRFVKGKGYPLPVPKVTYEDDELAPYVPDESLPKAIIVDIDGTVALKGTRSPFDETRVHEDRPNRLVIDTIRALWSHGLVHTDGLAVIFMSGRTEACRKETEEWLDEHVKLPYQLYMRAAGDGRKDSIVKNELFFLVRDKFNVIGVYDDRNQVVELWRKLGLQVYQVADGNF